MRFETPDMRLETVGFLYLTSQIPHLISICWQVLCFHGRLLIHGGSHSFKLLEGGEKSGL